MEHNAAYVHALQSLYARADFEARHPRGPEALRLAPVRRLLERLGNPQYRFAVVHIAGTKGKGSTAAMMEAVLRAAGYRTGLYTSPHLHTVRERVRLQGKPLPPADFVALLEDLKPWVDDDPQLTVFDILTALAFLAFAQSEVEVAVVEVGLGGRLDSTNVVAPSLCLVTRLGLDHTAILGPTLRHIAYEKAGIFKPGVPVVSAPQAPEALEVLRQVAADRGAPLHLLEPEAPAVLQVSPQGQVVRLPAWQGAPRRASLPLLGRHQAENAALVALAFDVLRDRGWSLPEAALPEGLAGVHWPGRFEVLRAEPPIVLDGAHNADAAQALVATVREVFPQRAWQVVFGVSRGKDPEGLLRLLQRDLVIHTLWVTQSRHPRAMPVEALAASLQGLNVPLRVAGSVADAFLQAVASGQPVLVTGSLFVVAEAREAWAAQGHMPMPEVDPVVIRVGQ